MMNTADLLRRLQDALNSGAQDGHGGVLFVRFDRATTLRDQLGYSGLEELGSGMAERVDEAFEDAAEILRFDWASILVIARDTSWDRFDSAAESLFSALTERPYAVEDDEVAVTVSLAHARFDHRFITVDELLLPLVRRVEALAEQGGNSMSAVRPGISAQKALDSSDHMLGLLMEALRTDGMKVVFQPLLATSGREDMESYQMLPRLAAGDGKLITAAEFLPLARDAALLPVLDRWMTIRASRLLRGRLKSQRVRLFINQSEAILADADRRDWLVAHLEGEPGLAGRLVLEIPVEDAMAHMKGTAALLDIAAVHDVGVCLSHVDEHSRWSLLNGDLKADYVRMSPSFVSRLSADASLEKRFMELSVPARERGVRIIMPMIEDSQTAASMWRSGADYMQGNMIQAPEDSIAMHG
jgi:EAL domain-containing protein (putative c-di-GMP-specific phosphodiesterase class I)/GGDEF domain-containing protein